MSEAARTFAEIATPKKGRSKGCPRCGAERNAGSITITTQALGPNGALTGGQRIASRSRSLCESCCVEVYEACVAQLLKETKAEE